MKLIQAKQLLAYLNAKQITEAQIRQNNLIRPYKRLMSFINLKGNSTLLESDLTKLKKFSSKL